MKYLADKFRNKAVNNFERSGDSSTKELFSKLLGSLLCLTLISPVIADKVPEFSWDTIPLYMHVRKAAAFTPDEINYLATFPLVTLEKTTGMKDFDTTEAGTIKAAEAIKKVNPKTKVLYYKNIIVHYPFYASDQKLEAMKSPFLIDGEGNDRLVRGESKAYDLTNKELQKWWLEDVGSVCASPVIDGLFIDGNIKALEPNYLKHEIGVKKKAEVEIGYHEIMKGVTAALSSQEASEKGSEKIVLANILRARFDDAGLEYIDYFDGSYIEQFEEAVKKMTREDYMAKGISAIQSAAQDGKIIAFTMGLGVSNVTAHGIDESRKHADSFESIRERFNYSMALFLICAEKHSYFMASDGYVANKRNLMWMKEIPEYSYALGSPKAAAEKKGYVYTREFEHASVTVDLTTERGTIDWKKK